MIRRGAELDFARRLAQAARLCLLACALAMAHLGEAVAAPVTVTDLLGRTVTLPAPAKRIVLAQGRQLNALGLIHPDPASVMIGWANDFQRQMSEAYALYRAKFPAIDQLAIVGDGTGHGFSFEKAVALEPDLVVLSLSIAGTRRSPGDLVAKFEAAGIPVVVVDFYLQPFRDTIPSLRILGAVLGRERQAAEFVSFYEARRRSLAEKLAGARRSRVFMHAHAGGAECCGSPGKGTFDDFITAAGGENIAAALIPGASGLLSLEQVLALDPEVYIATGGTHLARSGGLVLGLGVPRDVASRSFAALIGRPEFNALSAIRRRRAFALWQLFNDTPLHIAAIEAMAKSLHPDRFAELDPMATVSEISQRFSAIPLDGTFWLGPKDLPPGP